MDLERQLYKIDKDRISQVDESGNTGITDSENDYWLLLKAESRRFIAEDLKKSGFDTSILTEIENPGNSKNIWISGLTLMINLVIPETSRWYKRSFITILLRPGLMVTILDPEVRLFDELEEEFNQNPVLKGFNIFYLIYYMISIILNYSTDCVKMAREFTDELSAKMDDNPDQMELSDIISAKQHGRKLANIIEDQDNTLRLIPRIDWSEQAGNIEKEIKYVIDHFGFLSNRVNRLEDKIRDLHLQYQLILHEKSNKRLDALTIIQSIFVPLTFIAGIYGMNFIFMPELKWTYGYFLVLGFMVILTVGELAWFYKKGWFD